MKPKTIVSFLRNRVVLLIVGISRMATSYYRLCYVTALANEGILKILCKKRLSLEQIAKELSVSSEYIEALEAWLQVGVNLGELKYTKNKYSLRGFISKQLTKPGNDPYVAMVEEIVKLHHKMILCTPGRLKSGNPWTLNDQDGALIARSSRVLEPFIREAIDMVMPNQKPIRLLEIGCGSGIHIHYAATRNINLTATGLELQEDVAAYAKENTKKWRLNDRVEIRSGDIRKLSPDASYDLVTLHNNIYYFPVEARIDLLKHISDF